MRLSATLTILVMLLLLAPQAQARFQPLKKIQTWRANTAVAWKQMRIRGQQRRQLRRDLNAGLRQFEGVHYVSVSE
jgi:hypothetical protein